MHQHVHLENKNYKITLVEFLIITLMRNNSTLYKEESKVAMGTMNKNARSHGIKSLSAILEKIR
jgi:hypothetical protein